MIQQIIKAVPFGFIVSAALLLALFSEPSLCEAVAKDDPINVTISDLASHPREYDGKLVCVRAVVVSGWEGDNFLVEPSKPVPLDMPSNGDPAAVWFYTKANYERDHEELGQLRSACRSFVGYFHFVDKPQIVNRVFDPGPLQLEALDSSVPDQEPQSLAKATLSRNVDEVRRILRLDAGLRDKYKNLLLYLALYDDFSKNPQLAYQNVLTFLGVSQNHECAFNVVNANRRIRNTTLHDFLCHPPKILQGLARSLLARSIRQSLTTYLNGLNEKFVPRPEMNQLLRKRLESEYAEDVRELSRIVDRDLSNWTTT